MALAEAIAGAQRPSQIVTWTRGDNTPENLTDATLSGTITDSFTGETRAIAGSLDVTDGPNGVFAWVYGEEDVATAGRYEVQFTATFGSEPSPARTLLEEWKVHPVKVAAA